MQLKKSILNKNHAVAILIFRCHLFPMSGCSHLEHLTKFCPSLLRSIEAALMEWLAGVTLNILSCRWNIWMKKSQSRLHPYLLPDTLPYRTGTGSEKPQNT